MKINKPDEKYFQRESAKQIVRHDDENDNQFAHYHWGNRTNLKDKQKGKKGNKEFYKNKYGLVVERGSNESHLSPLDKDYKKKR